MECHEERKERIGERHQIMNVMERRKKGKLTLLNRMILLDKEYTWLSGQPQAVRERRIKRGELGFGHRKI